ncbi:MAG: hypothetical protein KF775_17075 [Cyclobacteriaceae bacterium]|nr:hypothetical protein [Cyclobacteriaceae bacterium]
MCKSVVAMALVLTMSITSVWTRYNTAESLSYKKETFRISAQHAAVQSPLDDSLPNPAPTDAQDENESAKQSEDNLDKVIPYPLSLEQQDSYTCRHSLRQLDYTLHNRQIVSLVILHHAWKGSVC